MERGDVAQSVRATNQLVSARRMYFFRLERCNRRLSRAAVVQLQESRSANERHGDLSRGHRVIFPPGARTERSRVGEVPATIAVHYAVHVAHVRQLARRFTCPSRTHAPREICPGRATPLARTHQRMHVVTRRVPYFLISPLRRYLRTQRRRD